MNKNNKWYFLIGLAIVLLILYIGYFFTDIGRGLGDNNIKTEDS